jgi:hypothetical protein
LFSLLHLSLIATYLRSLVISSMEEDLLSDSLLFSSTYHGA